MHTDIATYNNIQTSDDKTICEEIAKAIVTVLTEADSKIWHAHPVWFLDGNPIVGYSKQKQGSGLCFGVVLTLMKRIWRYVVRSLKMHQ